jgi:hypothetical protein
MSYNATFKYVNELGDERLSLIDHFAIHELIHVVRAVHPSGNAMITFYINHRYNFFR